LLEKKLKLKHEVLCVTPTKALTVKDSLIQRVNKSNSWNADLYVSLHHNCFNGQAHGSEVFALSKVGFLFAESIQNSLCGLGFWDRGAKTGEHLFVIKNTSAPAILIENFFVDSHRDCEMYLSLGPDKIANAIAKGINDVAFK
jgi:N-acetylmuramoyl-L-alanine amidase